MNSHFYVTLPSYSLEKYYPDNTVARFVTRLPETVRLDGEYEMALAEIIYPHNWFILDNKDGNYWFAAARHEQTDFRKICISSGYYEDGSAFATSLDQLMDVVFGPMDDCNVKVVYNETIGRLSLSVQSTGRHILVMSDKLQRYTGVDPKSVAVNKQSFSVMADVNRCESWTEPHVRILRRGVSRDRRRHKNSVVTRLQRRGQARRIRASRLRSTALRTGGSPRNRLDRNRYK
jgi:hypothetical protein